MRPHSTTGPRRSCRAFTRLQLAVALVLGLTLGTVVVIAVRSLFPQNKQISSAKSGKAIYNWLQAWANDHHQEFPAAPRFSNEAFRQLFTAGYVEDETGFATPGDAWLEHAPGGRRMPDNIIGTPPDFIHAIERGECSYSYVTGLDAASQSNLPLLGDAFSETAGVYSRDKSKKGGIRYPRAVWVSVGGSARVADIEENLRIMERRNDRLVDVFSSDGGTKIEDVKNPEP